MKSLLLVSYEYPPIGGGAANACRQYAQLLAARGTKVVVLTSAYADLPLREEHGDLVIVRIPAGRKDQHKSNPFQMFCFMLSAFLRLGNLVQVYKPDHALIFFVSPFGALGLALKWFHNVPFSVFARGGDIPGFVDLTDAYHAVLAPLTSLILKNTTNVFSNGMFLKELADKLLVDKEAINIPNGLEPRLAKTKKVNDKLKLLFVGRMVKKQKNFLVLPEILQQASELDLHLYIVGDGPDFDLLLAKIAEYKLESRVTILGWLNRQELETYYQLCDLLIFPSIVEGVSNVLVEAIASGMYVLANDIPDTRFFIENTGRGKLLKTNEASEYVALIKELIEDPSAIEAGISQETLQTLSWEASAGELESYLWG
ncbi:MAG: glycosyltransferase family 4 protein [Candidatus Melainabacteria bacterium]|jgi:glycogen synthase|nr:glycosyltransferase family 4 protein [Candidatus Melainabacteria bacterium]